jgi:hypothetical protein
MRRIDTPSAAQDLFGPGKHGFRNGDPANAVLATRLNAEIFNALQEELATVVEKAGLVLEPANNAQLLRAIRGGVNTLSASGAMTAAHAGLVLLDASGGARTFTLPDSAVAFGPCDYLLRRVDGSTNALVIAAAGTDKLMLDVTANPAGQASTELLFAGDFMRLRSDGAGKWWCVGQAQLPAGIATGRVVFTTVGVTNWPVPAVLRSGRRIPTGKITGGGGGGSKVSGVVGNGGGGGGTAIGRFSLVGVTEVPVTIGAPGLGGTGSAPVAGVAGGASSIGTYLSATGGAPGLGTSGKAIGGVGSGGDLNLQGGSGAESQGNGNGGDSYLGQGGLGPSSGSGVGSSGYGYGAGGAGSSGNQATGNGVQGYGEITW